MLRERAEAVNTSVMWSTALKMYTVLVNLSPAAVEPAVEDEVEAEVAAEEEAEESFLREAGGREASASSPMDANS